MDKKLKNVLIKAIILAIIQMALVSMGAWILIPDLGWGGFSGIFLIAWGMSMSRG